MTVNGWVDRVSQGVIFLLIVLAPIPNGSASPWSQGIILLGGLLLFALWAWRSHEEGSVTIIFPLFWLAALLFVALAGFTLIPLPPWLAAILSPRLHSLYQQTYPGYGGDTWLPLTVNPYATMEGITIALGLLSLMFAVIHSPNPRAITGAVIIGALAAAAGEAIFGLWQSADPELNIWSHEKGRISGTYVNPNHFAGLMAMAIPIAIGQALAALGAGKRKTRAARAGARGGPPEGKAQFGWIAAPLLLALAALLIVAAYLSLSRGGMISIAVGGLAMIALLAARGRYLASALSAGFCLSALYAAQHIGEGRLWARFSGVIEGEDPNLKARVDLFESGLRYIGDFPLLGSGLNSLRYVFELYQSPLQKDLMVTYLHSDWIQLFCETGIIGGLVFTFGLLILFVDAGWRAWRHEDAGRVMAIGGLLSAVLAMAAFSFSDFNLSLCSANAMIMALSLAAAYKLAISGSRGGEDALPEAGVNWGLTPAQGRVLLPLCLLAVLAAGARSALAVMDDFSFNRYLARVEVAGGPFRYFFINKGGSLFLTHFGNVVERAKLDALEGRERGELYPPKLRLNGDYREWEARALMGVYAASKLRVEAALESAKALFGEKEGSGEAARKFAAGLPAPLRGERLGTYNRLLSGAERDVYMAIFKAPTLARLHVLLANIAGLKGKDSRVVGGSIINAAYLAPNSAEILLMAARAELAARRGAGGGIGGAEDIISDLRRLLEIAPVYSNQVYDALYASQKHNRAYFMITPVTYDNYLPLYQRFLTEKEFGFAARVLRVLDGVTQRETRAARQNGEGAISESAAQRRLYVLKNIASVGARSQIWPESGLAERKKESRLLRRESQAEEAGEIQRLVSNGKYEEAKGRIERYLTLIWDDPAILLAGARAARSAAGRGASRGEQIDYLFRLLSAGAELNSSQLAAARSMLDSIEPQTEGEEFMRGLLSAQLFIMGGKYAEADRLLKETSLLFRAETGLWKNRGLLWRAWGEALDKMGLPGEARLKYENAAAAADSHEQTIARLLEITGEEKWASRLRRLEPEVKLNASFGGVLTLTGYSLRPVEVKPGFLRLTLHWRVDGDKSQNYTISVRRLGPREEWLGGIAFGLEARSGRKTPHVPGEIAVVETVDIPSAGDDSIVRTQCYAQNPPPGYPAALYTQTGNEFLDFRIKPR